MVALSGRARKNSEQGNDVVDAQVGLQIGVWLAATHLCDGPGRQRLGCEFARISLRWRAPEYLRLNADVLALVQAFDAANKPIAAVCHGAQLLAAAGILKGRECSAYPACGPEVQLAGGQYMDIGVDQAHVQGNLVTAPAWPAHPNWLAAFLRLLGTQISL